jgi:SAM-dependent methyltransferase
MAVLLGPPPRDVLDIATGTGFIALIAAGLGQRVTGIDLAEPMLAIARDQAARLSLAIDFRHDDALTPAFQPASFDVITCRHFLWTLRAPVEALTNWRALLRPGGRVVAIDGFWFDPEEEPPEGAGLFEQHYTPETRRAIPGMGFTRVEQVTELFQAAGFANISVEYLADVHRLAESPPGEAPWYVIAAERD